MIPPRSVDTVLAIPLISLSEGKDPVIELILKSETLGMLLRIDPGLKVSNHAASPAKLPTRSKPPRLAMSSPGTPNAVPATPKNSGVINSSPKSVTREPTSSAKSRMPPTSTPVTASIAPLIL